MTPELRSRIRAIFERFRDDPVGYVLNIIQPPQVSEDQLKLLKAAANPECRISVASGTTTGKTTTLAWIVLWKLSTRDQLRIPCTATTYVQVTNTLWPEIAKWKTHMRQPFGDMIRFQQEKVFLVGHENSSYAWPMAATKERVESFQGVHATNVLFICDEAAGISSEICHAIERSASTAGAGWIMAGNPNRASGFFYDSHHKNAAFWTKLYFSSLNSPFCRSNYAPGMASRYGIDSNYYRMGVLGKFPKSDADTLIPFDWVEESKERDIVPDKDQPRIAGLDPSGGGADPVGFCIRQGTGAYGFDEWHAIEAMPTVGRVMQMWKDKKFDRIVVDALGVGNGVASRLEELGVPVIPVNVSMKPIVKPDCFQLRDELWWLARDWFESRIVKVQPGKGISDDAMMLKFCHEVSMPKYGPHSTGKNKVEEKDSLRKSDRLGHSPNIADAFCLTFVQGIPLRNSRNTASNAAEPRAEDYPWD